MFKILDRYIIRKFLTTFFFMLGIIMLLSMVFDIADKLSDFIEQKASFSGIIVYYLNFILFYGNMFSSMIVFISVIWFTAKMAQDTEIIPMLNSGRPFTRIVRPYMIAATFLMLISLFLNHFIIPLANKNRLGFENEYYRVDRYVENYQAEFPGNTFIHFKAYNEGEDYFSDMQLEKYNDSGQLTHFFKARFARGKKGSTNWSFEDVFIREVSPPKKIVNAAGVEELIFVADKLREIKKLDTVLPFKMDELTYRDSYADGMTSGELKRFIERERGKGSQNVPSFQITLYQRTSYPFATYVLTLIGVSVASRKKRGGIGVSMAIGFVFVFLYIFAMQITTKAAIKIGFPPLLAVWLPNVMFGFMALVMYRLAPK